ncbi:NAD dependent epimerase/dehydratase family protein [Cordyceps fumosorosea ARSEF 2679]|uniref:NAD dependent epimerase/dehydratase family protein n=1 Tax=Cordyceps fumosorosea (strain ARSEF 2679) TaxID=1081104 RepID=A0A167ZKQ8_CORFA|nr:NAD dependent epimerase/dehydratase family protein [Cordyceps fumosorosea ARSEF 2679]OAA67630.1 NAD dependent epimerase/dehydratase family protein [Cordyceps fumosorosea ARSEF 2679]
MSTTTLLITGATGYIGGSILSNLFESSNPHVKALRISTLVRKQEQADLLKAKGFNGIVFSGLDDTAAASAIIRGLADRQKATGNKSVLTHTSGTSSIGDRPITRRYTETRVFDDVQAYLRAREDFEDSFVLEWNYLAKES